MHAANKHNLLSAAVEDCVCWLEVVSFEAIKNASDVGVMFLPSRCPNLTPQPTSCTDALRRMLSITERRS